MAPTHFAGKKICNTNTPMYNSLKKNKHRKHRTISQNLFLLFPLLMKRAHNPSFATPTIQRTWLSLPLAKKIHLDTHSWDAYPIHKTSENRKRLPDIYKKHNAARHLYPTHTKVNKINGHKRSRLHIHANKWTWIGESCTSIHRCHKNLMIRYVQKMELLHRHVRPFFPSK